MKLTDFDTIQWNAGYCAFCSETPNNVGNNLCNNHTDIYRKLRKQKADLYYNEMMNLLNIDLSQIENVEVDGLNHRDYPDYCDAFIASADQSGVPLTDKQLEFINESCRDFVYEQVMKKIY
jgi:hypothetical protein